MRLSSYVSVPALWRLTVHGGIIVCEVPAESPCECRGNHGEHRWAAKNDPSTPPVDASAIQAITPSDVFSCPGAIEAFDVKLGAYWDREQLVFRSRLRTYHSIRLCDS